MLWAIPLGFIVEGDDRPDRSMISICNSGGGQRNAIVLPGEEATEEETLESFRDEAPELDVRSGCSARSWDRKKRNLESPFREVYQGKGNDLGILGEAT